MPYHNYLCVFHANSEIHDDVVDCGLDPDFRPPLPTWGICRPQIRQRVVPGNHLVFLGYYDKGQRYLVKGWMRVGEKISYLDALMRFGNRPNVIIREARQTKPSATVHWKRKTLQEEALRRYGSESLRFLTTINFENQVFVQFDEDNHEIDNWKCQRMFLCQESQLKLCIGAGVCLREPEFPHLTGYVVAAEGGWQDVGRQRLDWLTIAPPRFRNRTLRTPRNQHNVCGLTDAEITGIIDALSMGPLYD